MHKYDIEDFEHVDPYLGGDQALADLRAAMSERGMRLLLDAVFNHCSDTHPWFNRWGTHPEPGAYQSAEPRVARPSSSRCRGPGQLPLLAGLEGHCRCSTSPSQRVQDYFYAGADAIVRRWLRPPYAIDGWRFDVIHMLGDGTGAGNNAPTCAHCAGAAKDENPDAYILGEHFFEATRWLQGDQEDGAMNYYGFAHPLRAFLAGQDVNYHPVRIDAAELDALAHRCPLPHPLCRTSSAS